MHSQTPPCPEHDTGYLSFKTTIASHNTKDLLVYKDLPAPSYPPLLSAHDNRVKPSRLSKRREYGARDLGGCLRLRIVVADTHERDMTIYHTQETNTQHTLSTNQISTVFRIVTASQRQPVALAANYGVRGNQNTHNTHIITIAKQPQHCGRLVAQHLCQLGLWVVERRGVHSSLPR